jgi:SAM-dependent methyltransferase
MTRPQLSPRTVRGRIRRWIEQCAPHFGECVLEVGTRRHDPAAWWVDNRDLVRGEHVGIDMQQGHGVDVVADVEKLPRDWTARYSGIICSEVLEHVKRPPRAIKEMARCLRPGGALCITTLFAFPEHGFPADYWRFTRSALEMMLADAGLESIDTVYDGGLRVAINDHGERRDTLAQMPMHVFALAFKPDETQPDDAQGDDDDDAGHGRD